MKLNSQLLRFIIAFVLASSAFSISTQENSPSTATPASKPVTHSLGSAWPGPL